MTPSEVRTLCLKAKKEGTDHVVLILTKSSRPQTGQVRLIDSNGPRGRVLSSSKVVLDLEKPPVYKVVASFDADAMHKYATNVIQEAILTERFLSPCCGEEIRIYKDHLSCAQCGDRVKLPGI